MMMMKASSETVIVLGPPLQRSPSWRLLRGFDANAFAHDVPGLGFVSA
jgi:hypothetical protein